MQLDRQESEDKPVPQVNLDKMVRMVRGDKSGHRAREDKMVNLELKDSPGLKGHKVNRDPRVNRDKLDLLGNQASEGRLVHPVKLAGQDHKDHGVQWDLSANQETPGLPVKQVNGVSKDRRDSQEFQVQLDRLDCKGREVYQVYPLDQGNKAPLVPLGLQDNLGWVPGGNKVPQDFQGIQVLLEHPDNQAYRKFNNQNNFIFKNSTFLL